MIYSESRPWGSFHILYEDEYCKVKKLIINPDSRLSLQSHENREEHWTIVYGEAYTEIDFSIFELSIGDTIDISYRQKHRVANLSKSEYLIIIEVQTGRSFEESDIFRYEDDYKRT